MNKMLHRPTVVCGKRRQPVPKDTVNNKQYQHILFKSWFLRVVDLRVSRWEKDDEDGQLKRTLKYIMPVSNPIGKEKGALATYIN